MASSWPTKSSNDDVEVAKVGADVADISVADAGPGSTVSPSPVLPKRPQLQRESSQPAPLNQPPPPPSNQPTDSLSLAQLRRIVSEFPRSEAVAYDFVYSDTDSHAEEIDEWFTYQFWQWARLKAATTAFEWDWEHAVSGEPEEVTWDAAESGVREKFVKDALAGLKSEEIIFRSAAVGRLLYIVAGRWKDTAGGVGDQQNEARRSVASPAQLEAIKSGVQLLAKVSGIANVWVALRNAFDVFWTDEPQQQQGSLQEAQDELMNLMTIMYFCIQEALGDQESVDEVREQLLDLNPSLVEFMVVATSKLRWDEGLVMPQMQIFLLFWKSILLVFGGSDALKETKKALRESPDDKEDADLITASPLDYHVFRQEITSKYPAYVPPRPALPLEADNTSLLPQLSHHPTRNNGSNGILPAPANTQVSGASILNQPVHIATPAPSPPPSPGVGGKGGKKQNYQTNQNFPFMYPPLDATSNSAGGKGGAGLQDVLVGRKWEGSDIPASILEAGELFSKRVRMTRAARQLWDEREKFLKFERGWHPSDDDINELDLDALSINDTDDEIDDEKLLATIERRTAKSQSVEVDFGSDPNLDPRIRMRLERLEAFYDGALPHIQSLVIVLLKTILTNVTALIMQAPSPQQQHPGVSNNPRLNGGPVNRSMDGGSAPNGIVTTDPSEMSLEEVDAARTREISAKALTGILLLLLKWFKISHVLKFEYLTQLLLDSNYLPLVLKLFAHQEIQQVVDSKTDRSEHSFFQFCNNIAKPDEKPGSGTNGNQAQEPDEESEDEAAPPPIKRRRSPIAPPAPPQDSQQGDGQASSSAPVRPEVDELGYPVNPLPQEPITDFSRRNFFSLINYLRVMQKICKNKAHRNLLLVQYKSSTILRKSLKVPQQELRLYTLKLFKNQVPYCGRKWRQTNMRVITAVYLHCRPELRDEWLAGSDVDAEVEEALPLEQALRSLTHWFNVCRYPEKMAVEVLDALSEEQDFFKRELEKIEIQWPDVGGLESVAGSSEWEHASQVSGWG